jgi:hypothetical protein
MVDGDGRLGSAVRGGRSRAAAAVVSPVPNWIEAGEPGGDELHDAPVLVGRDVRVEPPAQA